MSEEEYEYDEGEDEYSGDYGEEDEKEYTGLMALLHDEKMQPHVHLAILLTVTFIVAIIVYIAGY